MSGFSRITLVRSWTVPAGLLLVAAVSPFERPLPGSLAGFTFTTLELSIVAALAVGALRLRSGLPRATSRGAAAIGRDPAAFSWRTPITFPLLALLACAFAASAAAPEFRANAFRFTGRITAAFLLFSLAANAFASARLARQAIAVVLGVSAVVGGIAVLELAQVPAVLDGLTFFRPGFHVVGGQLRATSTLFYPTITSMYLEVAFALGLVFLSAKSSAFAKATADEQAVSPKPHLAFAALVLTGAGIIATFTRAGLITMTMSLLIYGGLTYAKRGRLDREHERLALLAGVLIALVMLSRSPQMLMARMSTDVSQDWYGATYDVPDTVTMRPGSVDDVPVTVSNHGRLTWQSTDEPVFAMSYHWLSSDTEEVVIYDGTRTPFPRPVAPGEEITMPARVRAPGYPGTYVLVWDVVQEHRTWLSLEGVYPGRTIASVEGDAVGAPLPTRGRMPTGTLRMPRSVLWKTALQITGERPVLGIGPDNYRLVYGRHLGMAAWDKRVHANNTYLEVLVGMGVVGLAALVWLVVSASRATLKAIASADATTIPLVAAATAACVAIAAHGMVDSFLTFTSTYVIFAFAAAVLLRVLPPRPPYSSVSSVPTP